MAQKTACYIEANERHQTYVQRFTSQMIDEYVDAAYLIPIELNMR